MDIQKTSTESKLNHGPADMPNRMGNMGGEVQTTSSQSTLSRTPTPVANLTNKPKMGEIQCNSTQSNLGRTSASPYDPTSATTPHTPLGGGRRKSK